MMGMNEPLQPQPTVRFEDKILKRYEQTRKKGRKKKGRDSNEYSLPLRNQPSRLADLEEKMFKVPKLPLVAFSRQKSFLFSNSSRLFCAQRKVIPTKVLTRVEVGSTHAAPPLT